MIRDPITLSPLAAPGLPGAVCGPLAPPDSPATPPL